MVENNVQKSGDKKVQINSQHGTARFATKKEIEETYVHVPFEPELWRKGERLPQAQGIILGSIEKAGTLYWEWL